MRVDCENQSGRRVGRKQSRKNWPKMAGFWYVQKCTAKSVFLKMLHVASHSEYKSWGYVVLGFCAKQKNADYFTLQITRRTKNFLEVIILTALHLKRSCAFGIEGFRREMKLLQKKFFTVPSGFVHFHLKFTFVRWFLQPILWQFWNITLCQFWL